MIDDDDILTPGNRDDSAGRHPAPPPNRTNRIQRKSTDDAGKGVLSKKTHVAGIIVLVLAIVAAAIITSFLHDVENSHKAAVKKVAAKPLSAPSQAVNNNTESLKQMMEQQSAQAAKIKAEQEAAAAARAAQPKQGAGFHTITASSSSSSSGGDGAVPPQVAAEQAQIAASPLIALHGKTPSETTSTGAPNTGNSIQAKLAALREEQRKAYAALSNNSISPGINGLQNLQNQVLQKELAASGMGKGGATTSPSAQQNQWEKSAGAGSEGYGALTSVLPKLHDVALYPGTIIPAVLVGRMNTQTPGLVMAQVTRTIYSIKGQRAVPAGSRLIGKYDSEVSNGQNRVMLSFTRVIFPDGKEIALGGMSATGQRGADGINGNVHTHFWTNLGSALLVAMITTGVNSIPNPNNQASGNTYIGTSSTSPTQAGATVLQQQAQNLLQHYENVPVTITVPAGTAFNIMVNKTVLFPESGHP